MTFESEVVLLSHPANISEIVRNVGELPDHEEKQNPYRKDDTSAKPEESVVCIVSQEDT